MLITTALKTRTTNCDSQLLVHVLSKRRARIIQSGFLDTHTHSIVANVAYPILYKK